MPYELATERPEVIAVPVQRFDGETLVEQVKQERGEEFHDVLARRDILFIALPTLRPLRKVRAILGQGHGGRDGHTRTPMDFLAAAYHAPDPPA
jgi:hypothetical protein